MATEPSQRPRGADIEIIDRNHGDDGLVPSALRINGVEILIPSGATIKIDDISDDSFVTATITMFVRSLTITSERPSPAT